MVKSEPSLALPYRLPYAGIVGNGRTCALIDARGMVGWMCVPTFAEFPLFASLLDPVHGGRLELGIQSHQTITWASERGEFSQRYLPGTNVLETTWNIDGCSILIRDAMPRDDNALVREIEIQGADRPAILLVRMRPTSPAPPSASFTIAQGGINIRDTRCESEGRLTCRGVPEGSVLGVSANEIVYRFAPGDGRLSLIIRYQDREAAEKAPLPPIQNVLQACQSSDERWLSDTVQLSLPDGELTEMFQRSLLALRLLIYEPAGALLAAATASFPSQQGGWRNWDYRYCWVRDGCYAAHALDLAGCSREAERLYEFLLERESNGQWASPLWAIDAGYPTEEEEVAGLAGPAGETPIRIGNRAVLQDQHDSPGNVLSGVYSHVSITGSDDLAIRHWERIVRAAEWCCEHWAELEAGIWEKRDHPRAWVHGRALCWVALRDALALAKRLHRPAPARWERAIEQIRDLLLTTGWSGEKGAFVRACGPGSVYDISALALVLYDLIPPEDQRIRQTIQALVRSLAYGAAFRRDEEDTRTAFYLATFWIIRALQRVGEYDQAYAHLRAAIGSATNLGIMAEYFDPLTGRQHGNLPQAFSHEELIQTVIAMLWRFEGNRLVLFPAIPSGWLVPGTRLSVSNIPFGGKRAAIGLTVERDVLDFTIDIAGFEVVVPERYSDGERRVRLNGVGLNSKMV